MTRSLLSAHCRFVYDVRFPVLRIHTILTKCQACTCDLLYTLPYDTLNNDLCKAALRSPILVRKWKRREFLSLTHTMSYIYFCAKRNARGFLRIGRGPFVRKAIVNLLMVLHRRETSLVPLYKLGLVMPNSTGLPTARGIKSYRSSISFFSLAHAERLSTRPHSFIFPILSFALSKEH